MIKNRTWGKGKAESVGNANGWLWHSFDSPVGHHGIQFSQQNLFVTVNHTVLMGKFHDLIIFSGSNEVVIDGFLDYVG
jgi:hypothetical protein